MTPGKAGGLLGEPLKGVLDYQGRSKQHPQLQLVVAFLFGFLVADVLNDRRLIQSNRRHKVTSGPKILARAIPLLSYKKIALFPFRYPTPFDTAYFGAIRKRM